MKRILDIVDASKGFMKQGCDLPIGANQEGAEELIAPTNELLAALKPGSVDVVLFKLDTHFGVEYPLTEESKSFPLHSEYGTEGWELAVDPSLVDEKIPVRFMTKNTFDMWDSNPVALDDLLAHHGVNSFEKLPFKRDEERAVYKNLFHVTDDPRCIKPGVPRDEFLKDVGPGTEVVLCGVASNFCDADAMYGYLVRGAQVTVLRDLVKGIPIGEGLRQTLLEVEGIDRTVGGTIEEVLETERFRPFVEAGLLRLETSAEFLNRVQPAPQPAGTGFKPPSAGPV